MKDNPNKDIETLKEFYDIIDFFSSSRIDQVPETYEIVINYVMNEKSQWNMRWNRNEVNVDVFFDII